MKKTIAILLVMTMALVGVFAAAETTTDKTLKITTAVSAASGFKVTSNAIGENNFGYFNNSLTTIASLPVTIENGIGADAYLSVANNSTTASLLVYMKAANMIASGVDTTIGYKVTCNEVVYDTLNDTENKLVTTVLGSSSTGIAMESDQISVVLNSDSYYDAAPGNYEGIITFTISAS
ncbi:hypothetical protein SpiGrapes_1374 [Sphaerochaeta pleomorpha str. Grapes]|uniref:Uncharacterized protein n=1 Tax=Sphaerochaeta pleomorpha (strain ATCC BAA-1885 / DSM 22778 / Grapes) TaxID=158190 RepID=G8QUF3_SPHPG|nr:hypothetical protein [Sphaerochaeta pleomorpha]AEV29186.1 hypothetical protein SpiGrapes_1374 [Sphaerochaeta pleomorpha str. Grapes]